jgi:L-threonylcarbamoyladenylate synthase
VQAALLARQRHAGKPPRRGCRPTGSRGYSVHYYSARNRDSNRKIENWRNRELENVETTRRILEFCHDSPMDRVRVDLTRELAPQLRIAAEAVRAGRVVGFPTDTLYGLAVNPFDPAAVAALYALKGRGGDQPVPLIAADADQVAAIATVPAVAMRLARTFWPGPLTLLLRSTAALAAGVGSPDGLVGIRVPASEIARALARGVGHPVTATSANRSGEPPTANPDVVASSLHDLDVLVDGGDCRGGRPSTIVDVGATPRLVREGAIPWSRVLEFLDAFSG